MTTLRDATDLVSGLIDAPIYVVESTSVLTHLSAAEWAFIAGALVDARAFTACGLDALLHRGALRYRWRGRGCAVVLCEPVECLSDTAILGLLAHEGAHYLEAANNPVRDAPIDSIDFRRLWRSMTRHTDRSAHGETWLAAAIHLWQRARTQSGLPLKLRDVLGRRYGHAQSAIDAVAADAQRYDYLPIADVVEAYREPPKPRRRVSSQTIGRLRSEYDATESSSGPPARRVEVIPVVGMLDASSYFEISEAFNAAVDNSEVSGIVLLIDSPGGEAIGPKTLADQIYNARGAKPVTAHVHGSATNAAYYIASACEWIEAVGDSLVGGVGMQYAHQEYSGALNEFGIGTTVLTNVDSPKKSHGNPYKQLTPESKRTLQEFVNSYGRPFIADVARYRGLDYDDVATWQGDAVRASRAVKLGMVDAVVGGLDETITTLGVDARAAKRMADKAERRLLSCDRRRRLNMAMPLNMAIQQ